MMSLRTFFVVLLSLSLIILAGDTRAAIGDPQAAGGASSDPGCAKEYMELLGKQESGYKCKGGGPCDKQYLAINDIKNAFSGGKRDYTFGKYQFTQSEWNRIAGTKFPQCSGHSLKGTNTPCTTCEQLRCVGDSKRCQHNSLSKDCWPAQEWAALELQKENAKYIKERYNWCPGLLGSRVCGKHVCISGKNCQKGVCCTVTKGGILSAAHNGGRGNICNKLKRAGKVGDHLRSRVCTNQAADVPEDCNNPPPTVPPTVAPPDAPGPDPQAPPRAKPTPFDELSADLKSIWVGAFMLMTSQITTTMMQQVEIIGTFFDAKHQLETQRLMQQKFARAHKDYHPSEQMCEIGTFVRNLADTEERAKVTHTALSRSMLDRATGAGKGKTQSDDSDEQTRLKLFIGKFCNEKDNSDQNDLLCRGGKPDPTQKDADINYTHTIDMPLTLDINLIKLPGEETAEDVNEGDKTATKDEENVFALIDYIFMNDSFAWRPESVTVDKKFHAPYQDVRSLIAMRSVAQDSFSYIISEKTKGPTDEGSSDGPVSVAPFLKALMLEMGIHKDNIEETIGKNPSYYAQMEILTKKIYQHPEFMSNLYDKPANVKRLRAAMTAIKVMQDRDIHKALMRREMLMSMLLELQLRQQHIEDMAGDVGQVTSTTETPRQPEQSQGGNKTF